MERAAPLKELLIPEHTQTNYKFMVSYMITLFWAKKFMGGSRYNYHPLTNSHGFTPKTRKVASFTISRIRKYVEENYDHGAEISCFYPNPNHAQIHQRYLPI